MKDDLSRSDHSAFFDLMGSPDFAESEYWHRRNYEAGTTILLEGTYSGKVFLLLSGETRIIGRVAVNDGYHIRPGVRDLTRGDVFGEFSMLDGGPHSASVMAVSNCEVVEMDTNKLLSYLDYHPSVGYLIFRELATCLVERLRKTDKQLLSLLAWGLKVREYNKYMGPDT